ncbi:MAG: hypothetical protein KF813_08075 [Trueperaceae bacterium]|nr:hypothetical protein [Trueperaceae bacterium]
MSSSVLGNTGSLGADAVLDSLRNLRTSGTLVVSDARGSMILQLAKGQVEASFKLGAYQRLEATNQDFHMHPHAAGEVPELPGRAPESGSALLRALPRLSPGQRLPAGAVELSRLVEALSERSFTGVLSFERQGESAAAVFLEGSIRAAVHERGGRVLGRVEALRMLQKLGREAKDGVMTLEPLDTLIAEPLVALALDNHAPEGAEPFTGVDVDDRGYRFVRNGSVFLCVPSQPLHSGQRYSLPSQAQTQATELALPSEPPGWEDRRYTLTLRGKDALNPMTELNMTFSNDHGEVGKAVLETLGNGATLEQAAQDLTLDLSELKPWLDRLEGAGLIRARG